MLPGFYYSAFLEQLQSMSEERIFFSLSKGFRAHGKILKKVNQMKIKVESFKEAKLPKLLNQVNNAKNFELLIKLFCHLMQ